MNNNSKEFLLNLRGTIRGFTPTFRPIYTNIMNEFNLFPDSNGYDQISTDTGFDDPSIRGVAHRMYWWFPTHFYKFQDALIRCEEKCHKKNLEFILNKPQVTFVDLGCGAGAASVALLSLIEQYQIYLQKKGVRTDTNSVNIVALDPCQAELEVYERVLREYSLQLSDFSISVHFSTICLPFPQGTQAVIEELSSIRGNVLIVGMSNLIHWIWNEGDIYWEENDLQSVEELQPDEAIALKNLALKSDFDTLFVIGIATKNRLRWWLADKLTLLINKLLNLLNLSKHPFGDTWRFEAEVLFENPEGSRYAEKRAHGTSRYFVESIVDIDPNFYSDEKLHDALSIDTLEKAWVKARNYMSYESLVDRVELKLFDVDHNLEIEKLRNTCLDRIYQSFNIEYDLPYYFPKNKETTRPKSLARLEEQIVAVALSLVHKDILRGKYPSISFSFRLAPEKSEYLYQYWFQLYSKYLASILKNLDDDSICTSDIKSFYTNIGQSTLLGILAHRLGESRCFDMFDAIIRRDCHADHATGYGILQGHAISGLIANVMLQPVDEQMVDNQGMMNNYFRFADDVTFTGIKSKKETTQIHEVVQFQKILWDHEKSLELNITKTQKYESAQVFRSKISGSSDLDKYSARFRKLLLPIYVMNRDYRREFSRIGWHFVYEYQKLLADIGLYFSPEWLYRKIDEYTRPRKLVTSQIKILRGDYSIDFPQLSLHSSHLGQLGWSNLFGESNKEWFKDKQNLGQELSAMFQHSANRILNDGKLEHDLTWYNKRIKFALYRLSVFGMEDIADQISMLLISQPWNIPVWLSCRGLSRAGLEIELFNIIENSQSSYVRAMALKALGTIRTASSLSILALILDNDNVDMIEKLMASEALLDSNFWHNIQYSRIMSWINQLGDEPYVLKNIILILAQAYPDKLGEYLLSVQGNNLHPIVNRVIHYAKNKSPTENLIRRTEPEIIRKYRAKSYPIIEELLQEEGSYRIASF